MSPHYSELMFYLKIVWRGEDEGKADSTAQRMAPAAPSAQLSLWFRGSISQPVGAAVPGTRLRQGGWIAAGQARELPPQLEGGWRRALGISQFKDRWLQGGCWGSGQAPVRLPWVFPAWHKDICPLQSPGGQGDSPACSCWREGGFG